MKRTLFALILTVSFAAGGAERVPQQRQFVHLPAVEAENVQNSPAGMIALHGLLALVRFYSQLLATNDRFVTYESERGIYERLLRQLEASEIAFSSKYVKRFVAKWSGLVRQKRALPSPMGLERAENLNMQLMYIEDFLHTDLQLLEKKYPAPKGLVALTATRAVIEAGKGLALFRGDAKFTALISATVREVTAPHLLTIVDEVVRAKNPASAFAAVSKMTASRTPSGADLFEYDHSLSQLVELLHQRAEGKL